VRARQLEGTYPDDPATGVWPITSGRIFYGWGAVPENAWPFDGWPPQNEPAGINSLAKQDRMGPYQRVRQFRNASARIHWTDDRQPYDHREMVDAPGGHIAAPLPGESILGAHVVCLVGYDDPQASFKFISSWGSDWGDAGFGYIS
jgi:hypothetical protein